jgi:hypothetical protein
VTLGPPTEAEYPKAGPGDDARATETEYHRGQAMSEARARTETDAQRSGAARSTAAECHRGHCEAECLSGEAISRRNSGL